MASGDERAGRVDKTTLDDVKIMYMDTRKKTLSLVHTREASARARPFSFFLFLLHDFTRVNRVCCAHTCEPGFNDGRCWGFHLQYDTNYLFVDTIVLVVFSM